MSSTSDGATYGGLSALAIINLGIWIPIIVMISAYFMCSTKYRYCKSIRTGEWCCYIKRIDIEGDSDDTIMLRNVLEGRVNSDEPDIYRISPNIGFDSLEELQQWYNNFEENRHIQQSRSHPNNTIRNNTTVAATPPPSYASLFSRDDDVPSYDDLPKLV